jgi:carbamoyltransferase
MKRILGISAFYHDSAAALTINGEIISAAQEERFSRKKQDASFPWRAIEWCLAENNLSINDIDSVIFYDKPFLTFDRIIETFLNSAPLGLKPFIKALPIWLSGKLFLKVTLTKLFRDRFGFAPKEILFSEHHRSHAASAFYPSPFEEAAVLCMDGVGEWATTSIWKGKGTALEPLLEIRFPHSLGLLYSAFTQYTGFKVNSGEYKLMGLAPYGKPVYVDLILKNLINLKKDGSFALNMKYFGYCNELQMTNENFHELFGGPPREPESQITQREMDLARSIQDVLEVAVINLARKVKDITGCENLCMAGGVALNCVANGKLRESNLFKNIWIQPAAGDAGGALGAALVAQYSQYKQVRVVNPNDSMKGSFLGPSFSKEEIRSVLVKTGLPFVELTDEEYLKHVVSALSVGKVVGLFQGRMEFGPRALGARSILGDARSTKMQSIMNLKIKFRESFRPFAPMVLKEKARDWFDFDQESPYMLMVASVLPKRRKTLSNEDSKKFGIDLINTTRSEIPAVTHVDYSARLQTIDPVRNSFMYNLIESFEKRTGCPVLVNTSFNVRGEPIVCTPEDAIRCFQRTHIDMLAIGPFVLEKSAEIKTQESKEWMHEFTLD